MPNNSLDANQEFVTIYYDDEGQSVLEIGAGQYILHFQDGTEVDRKTSQSFQLECGLQFTPAMSHGQQPVLIGICQLCRRPPYRFPFRKAVKHHGLVSMARSRRCRRCGKLLCPNHYRRCRDNRYRCISPCTNIYNIRRLVRRLFFTVEEI